MRFRSSVFLFTAAALLLSQAPGHAATSPVSIGGDVISYCTAPANQTLAFGNYDPVAASALTASASFTGFQCTLEQSPTIQFSVSGGGNPNNAHCTSLGTGYRAMTSTAGGTTSYLCYQLYEDSRDNTAWPIGTGVLGTALSPAVTPQGFGSNMTLTLYGAVPAKQDVRPATGVNSYSDTVTVTVSY